MHHWGLCYLHQHTYISLPLLSVRAAATVKELGAQVKLTQKFSNEASMTIEAVYSFPVPARAAVCSFTMVKQDGTRIEGIVQEKKEAKATYDTAISEGKTASLAAQQSPDVFQVVVGNIASKEEITIELIYATELAEDEDNDSMRFHLPAHIGSRYGQAPSPNIHTGSSTFINIDISIECTSPIRKIGSPSHSVTTELGPDASLPNAQELPFANFARVSLASDAPFAKDFVLTIQSSGTDAPRCVAELHPEHDTIGLVLTLVPRFNIPEPKSQEFIFVVDRSGSMDGSRISAARKALVIMLRSLPHKNTSFQIVSFGNRSTMLWAKGSHPYNQDTLDEATQHVDRMQADYGGTNISVALQTAFESRMKDRPTNVIVLTDGDAWDNGPVFEVVKKFVGAASSDAPLRAFCLGIGNSASTAMCEGIGRAGNGTSTMVGEDESSITGKIARLLKAARTPRILDVGVDWGRPMVEKDDDFEIVEDEAKDKELKSTTKKLNIFDESVDLVKSVLASPPVAEAVALSPPDDVQSSPFKIESLVPGFRIYVYAIVQGKKTLPKTITLRGATADGAEVELSVPVTISTLPIEGPPALHALAARKIIQDLDDGQYDEDIRKKHPNNSLRDVVKARIVRLGKTYSIGSSETSFVAVDKNSSVPQPIIPVAIATLGETRTGRGRGGRGGLMGMRMKMMAPAGSSAPVQNSLHSIARPRAMPRPDLADDASDFMAVPPAPSMPQDFMSAPPPPPPAGASPSRCLAGPPTDRVQQKKVSKSSAETSHFNYDYDAVNSLVHASERLSSLSGVDILESLARLQAFDGSFKANVLPTLKSGLTMDGVKASAGRTPTLHDDVLATLVAMAFISMKLKEQEADGRLAWEGIYDKAKGYLDDTLSGQEMSDLLAKVASVL